MPRGKHLLEDTVRVGPAAGGAQGLRVVHPGKDDDFGSGIETKKQPKPTADLGAPPVPKRRPKGVALAITVVVGIGGDCLEDQFRQCIEKLDVGIRSAALWVVCRGAGNGGIQFPELLDKVFVGEVFDQAKHLLRSKDERKFTPVGRVEGVYAMKWLGAGG